jgi:hypothetical protein
MAYRLGIELNFVGEFPSFSDWGTYSYYYSASKQSFQLTLNCFIEKLN